MKHEREAVVAAIESTANLNEAARRLGASRKTLWNRQHEYGLPPGQAGRRKQELPHASAGVAGVVSAVAVVGVFFGVGWLLRNKTETQIAGDTARSMHGLDIILAR